MTMPKTFQLLADDGTILYQGPVSSMQVTTIINGPPILSLEGYIQSVPVTRKVLFQHCGHEMGPWGSLEVQCIHCGLFLPHRDVATLSLTPACQKNPGLPARLGCQCGAHTLGTPRGIGHSSWCPWSKP